MILVSRRYQRYQPNKSDSRLIFAISDGTVSAPEIQVRKKNVREEIFDVTFYICFLFQVLRKHNLEEQLVEIQTQYLSNRVTINLEEEKVGAYL